jgi:hypothetical protein
MNATYFNDIKGLYTTKDANTKEIEANIRAITS